MLADWAVRLPQLVSAQAGGAPVAEQLQALFEVPRRELEEFGRELTAAAFAQGGAWATLEARMAAFREQVPEEFRPTLPPPPPTPWSGDLIRDASNLFAAWADTLTFGVTSWARQGLGYDDVVDYNSEAYQAGVKVGRVHNMALMLAGGAPVAGFLGTALKGINAAAVVGGVYHGVEAIRHGDYLNGLLILGGAGTAAFRGVGVSGYGRGLTWGVRGLHAGNALVLGVHGFENLKDGNYVAALIDFADAAANTFMISRSCFVAGTPLLVPGGGSRPIEDFAPGDEVLTRSEFDPEGPLESRRVAQTFVRVSPIIKLYVSGRAIGTTREHPFYVEGRGWLPAAELRGGERLLSHSGEWLVLDGVDETGEVLTVHNLEVEEHHTYFVGAHDWGFSLWAHNAADYYSPSVEKPGRTIREKDFRQWLHDKNIDHDAVMLAAEKQDHKGFYEALRGKAKWIVPDASEVREAYNTARDIIQKKNGVEEHHLMTNKNDDSRAEAGPYTPKFMKLAKQRGWDTLDHPDNIVSLQGHQGPHARYNRIVWEVMSQRTAGLHGEAFNVEFDAALAYIRQQTLRICATINYRIQS